MSTADTITFAVANSFHKIELSKSLLRFAEFDFTYFWEQCIETGRNARKTGRISQNLVTMAMNAIVKCHPYVEANANSEFSSVVLDCIIAYICHSEAIGLEELWARCISPKSLYEKAIFGRVSEYKTNRAINQWINIVRMQEYARSKMNFIYENEGNAMLNPEDYRARREYFDLAFSVAANETGCPMKEMPSYKVYTPSQLPDSVFMMGRVSKSIYRRLSDTLAAAEMCEAKNLNNHTRDQAALDAFSYVKDMPRPAQIDMKFTVEALASMPDEVYLPDSFKAAIDLEFYCMAKNDIYLSKCPRCERFFVRSLTDKNVYCSRVTSSGKTCTEQVEDELMRIVGRSEKRIDTADLQESESQIFKNISTNQEQQSEALPTQNHSDIVEPQQPAVITQKQPESESERREIREIPKDLEKRCQRVYNLLYKRMGRLMTESELSEWSKYLTDMKRDVRTGDIDLEQLEAFLDYWETAVKKQSGKLKRHEKYTPYVPQSFDTEQTEPDIAVKKTEEAEQDSLSDLFNEVLKQTDENENSGISPAGTEVLPEERAFKPFTPPKYNTVLEAMLDGKYKSDELLSETTDEATDDITVNGKKITLPNWERISRK